MRKPTSKKKKGSGIENKNQNNAEEHEKTSKVSDGTCQEPTSKKRREAELK